MPRARLCGWAALACWTIHMADSLLRLHQPINMLWGCNVACLAVGLGLLRGWTTVVAGAVLWTSIGVPFWFLDLLGGGAFIATTALTHLGALGLGAAGLAGVPFPRGTWWKALSAAFLLQEICRWTTPVSENVNLCAAVWPGWEGVFPSYPWYRLFVLTIFALSFWGLEKLFLRAQRS